jgi:hypothetical protein
MSIDELLEEILNADTIPDIVNYGKCIRKKDFVDEVGNEVEVAMYEYNSKTYISQYVNGECVMFDDIKNVSRLTQELAFESVRWAE